MLQEEDEHRRVATSAHGRRPPREPTGVPLAHFSWGSFLTQETVVPGAQPVAQGGESVQGSDSGAGQPIDTGEQPFDER
jgi:hypothetical protein